MRTSTMATLAIVLVTAIWGSTFFIIKDTVAQVDPVDFLAVRFAIGALLPTLIFWRSLRRMTRGQWVTGLGLGALYGVAQIVQTTGLQTTSASTSGFITGTYVVITPLIMWLAFRSRLRPVMWVAVAMALAGLAVLSLQGVMGGGVGELLTLSGAALYAVHIVLLDRWAKTMDAPALATSQLIGIAVICIVAGLPGGYAIPATPSVWAAIAYTAIAAGIVTMGLQTWAQRHITPTRVALLMTLEPVFASVFALAFGGENPTVRLAVGGGLILVATILGTRSDRPEAEPVTA